MYLHRVPGALEIVEDRRGPRFAERGQPMRAEHGSGSTVLIDGRSATTFTCRDIRKNRIGDKKLPSTETSWVTRRSCSCGISPNYSIMINNGYIQPVIT